MGTAPTGLTSNPAPLSSCSSPAGIPKCACLGSDTNKCSASGTLGIKHGHCYTVTDLHAKLVTRSNAPSLLVGANDGFWCFDGPWVPFAPAKMRTRRIVQVMCAKRGRTGRVGSYWTKSAFRPNKYRPCRRQNMAHRLLLVSDGLAKEADKGNIRSFTAHIQCFFGQCSHCLSLVPKTGATPSFVGLDLSFVASYGDAVLLDGPEEPLPLCHLPGDSLSNLTVASLAARAYRLSRRHFFELLDDQRPSKAFLIA